MTKETVLNGFARYVAREVTLEAFAEWIASHTQEVLDRGDEAAIRLMDQADVLLVELSNGEIPQLEFFNRLAAIVDIESTIPLSYSFDSKSPAISYGQSQYPSEEVTLQDRASLN